MEVRLFGSFEIRHQGEPLAGLDSTSARALIAYLALQPGRVVPRDQVASLLWPEVDDTTARHNLRQALYNLRQSSAQKGLADGLIQARHRDLTFEPSADVWVDVLAFGEQLARAKRADGGIDPVELAHATQLYRGDLLAGFYIRDSPPFEEWLLAEQERLREEVVQGLRLLVRHHLEAGNYPFGMQYVRRLLRIDPYLEEAHRDLMRLFALSGRRGRALSHFQDLQRQLEGDLGVEPSEETTALANEIEQEQIRASHPTQAELSALPRVPFVARQTALAELQETWAAVLRGTFRITWIEGPLGYGKTRLVRSFLDQTTSAHRATVLLGSARERLAPSPYCPLVDAFANALATDSDLAQRILVSAGSQVLSTLTEILPELTLLEPRIASDPNHRGPRELLPALWQAISRVIDALADRGGAGRPVHPVILFLDDLQCGDAATISLIESLASTLADRPCWVIGAYRPDDLAADHPLRRGDSPRSRARRLQLGPLEDEGFTGIGQALLGPRDGPKLGHYLQQRSTGSPLVAIELINVLAEQTRFAARPDGQWRWLGPAVNDELGPEAELDDLIAHRLGLLSPSVRRVLSLAAVIGPVFEAEVLQRTEGELPGMVELALRNLMERWWIRPFPRYWGDSRTARWSAAQQRGALSGMFEFTHSRLREVVYHALPASRRRDMHCRIAEILERSGSSRPHGITEALAFHFHLAGQPELAYEHAQRAAQRANALASVEIERTYRELVGLDEIAERTAAENRSRIRSGA